MAGPIDAQELRNEIAIVRAFPIPQLKNTYEKMSIWLENAGEQELARTFKGRTDGSHGTAFTLKNEGNVEYFVTNYHVVAGSDRLSLEFHPLNGEPITLEECEVVYIDPQRDLALIRINSSSRISFEGFETVSDSKSIKDGIEIWAAGYPGLISEPVWQLSNGIVSNQKAIISELVNDKQPYLIQHTSVIDPGSSGGPLMILDGSEYKVIGVNSMTAIYRHNTFYSIPSDTLSSFIAEFVNGHGTATRESLEYSLEKFTNLISSEDRKKTNLTVFFSDLCSSEKGWDLYLEKRKDISLDLRTEWDKSFFSGNVLKAGKEVLAADLMNALGDDELFWEILLMNEDSAEVELKSGGGKTYKSKWVFSRGIWTIDEYPSPSGYKEEEKTEKRKSSGDYDRIAYFSAMAISGGPTYAFGKFGSDPSGFGGYLLNLEFFLIGNKYIGHSFNFGWESMDITGFDSYENHSWATKRGCLDFGYNLNFFPTKLIRGNSIVPVIKGGVGIDFAIPDLNSMSDTSTIIMYYWLVGAGIQFEPTKLQTGRFGIMVDFKSANSFSFGMDDESGNNRLGLILSYIIKF